MSMIEVAREVYGPPGLPQRCEPGGPGERLPGAYL